VRALIDSLARESLRVAAADVLEEITGKKIGAKKDDWEAWWRDEGAKS
jgi:hypothetical protein